MKYRDHVVSPARARASADGTYQDVIRGWLAGTKTVRVTGAFHSWFAVQTCEVIRR